jgi:RNA polymerase-interacting CarD/CdnL/TRCF family regulator
MSQALRKLTGNVHRSNTTLFFINQIRMKIGVMFGSPETTTGGNALKFYSSVRLDVRRVGAIKVGEQAIGNRTRVKVVKNKLAPPFTACEFDILFGEGISKSGDALDLGVEANVIEKSGAWYTYDGERIGQGRETARMYLKEHPDALAAVERKVLLAKGVLRPEDAVPPAAGSEGPGKAGPKTETAKAETRASSRNPQPRGPALNQGDYSAVARPVRECYHTSHTSHPAHGISPGQTGKPDWVNRAAQVAEDGRTTPVINRQFQVGDNAVYPAHGVAEITGIESRDIAGQKKEFYILKILETDMKLMIPTDGAQRAGLRDVISKKDAKKVLEILKDPAVAVTVQPWNKRYREYTEMLTSGSAFEVAKVLRDLYRVKEEKELSFSERRLLEQARNLVVTELALARKTSVAKVEKEIEAALGA